MDVKPIQQVTVKEITGSGHQKCYLNVDVMKVYNIKVASFVCLRMDNREYICQAWPQSTVTEHMIKYSPNVYRKQTLHPKTSSYNSICNLKLLRTFEAEIINVSLIVSSIEKLSNVRRNFQRNPSGIENMCKNLMYKLCVSQGYTIDLEELDLAKLYGVSFIEVSSCNNDGFVIVTQKTKIFIEDIKCKEQFEQLNSVEYESNLVGGLDSVIKELEDMIMTSISISKTVRHFRFPKGILLRGPPGTGKTSVVNVVARKCKAYLITINGPEVFGARPGDTEENMRHIFEKALTISKEGRCVLFIDEIDAICPRRWKSGDAQESRATSLMLSFFDRIASCDGIIIIGATNRPGEMDPALRRPGRFDKEIMVNFPSHSQRTEILRVHTLKFDTFGDLDLDRIAALTNGYVGADLAAVCNEAAYIALMNHTSQQLPKIETDHFLTAVKKVQPSVQKGGDITMDLRPVAWEDIGGLQLVKLKLQQAVEWPIVHPKAFERMGLPCPKGVLLYGPPGCCKTTLVRAAATTCGATFLAVSGAQLYSPFIGDSEKIITEVFHRARAGAPSIIFLDEVDSIVGKRGDSTSQRSVQERVLSTLLNEMDGVGIRLDEKRDSSNLNKVPEGHTPESNTVQVVERSEVSNRNILVVAATNRPDMLDEALTRPGRLDKIIYVPPPDTEGRKQILSVLTQGMQLDGVSLTDIADSTAYYTGADLQNLCKEAALTALTENLEATHVTMDHFDQAMTMCKPSLTSKLLDYYENLSSKGQAPGRKQILSVLTQGMQLDGVSLTDIADSTAYYTGADLQNLCKEAALTALTENLEATHVTMDHFDQAMTMCKPSLTSKLLDYYENLSSKGQAPVK